MRYKMNAAMLGCGLGVVCAAWAAAAPVPEIGIPVAETPPVLDGRLDDEAWQQAAVIDSMHVFAREGETTDRVRLWLTRDDQWLYLGARITHPMPDRIRPRVLERDGGVHQDDSIEIFIDPGTEGALYLHYLLNAANVRAEQQFTLAGGEYDRDRGWDVPWRSATRITDEGWQAEIAIPLSVLASYGRLDALRMNVCVNQVVPVIDAQEVEIYDDHFSFTWSAIERSFHQPARFGRVRGLEAAQPEMPFLVGLRDVRAGAYERRHGQHGYPLAAELHTLSPHGRDLELHVLDRPLGAEPAAHVFPVAVKGPRVDAIEVFIPVAALSSRTAEAALVDPESGEVLQRDFIIDTEHLTLLTRVYSDRSYYTTEPEAVIRGELALPPGDLAGMTLAVRDAAGAFLARDPNPQPEARIHVPLTNVSEGMHAWDLVLLDERDAAVISRGFTLIKREPRPGHEWKTDRLRGVILRDGEPYFPFGVVFRGEDDDAMRLIAETGMNSVLRWNPLQDPDRAADFHHLAASHGLLVVEPLDRYADTNLIAAKSRPDFPELVEANMDRMLTAAANLKREPTLMAWFHFDEPQFPLQVEPGRKLYRAVNELDGYHPWMILFSSNIPPGDHWLDWSDILGTDPYWIPAGPQPRTGVRGTVNYVAKITTWTRRRAQIFGHPTYVVPVGERWSGMRKRILHPSEQRAQSYLAILHGARGLFYFAYPYRHRSSIETLRELNAELVQLTPAVLTGELPQNVDYSPMVYDPDTDRYPDVHAALFEHPEGGYLLLAVNSRAYPVETSFRVDGLGDGEAADLFGADRLPASGGRFGERLEPYAARAYRLRPNQRLPRPVNVRVEMTAFPEQADPVFGAVSEPDAGRVGRRNLVRNPSFEDATIPGWPDYMLDFHAQHDRYEFAMVGEEGDRFRQDTAEAWHGDASLRIESVSGTWRRWLSWWTGFSFTLRPHVTAPTRYVFSAYMKADREGVVARMTGFDAISDLEADNAGDQPEFELTTEWRRYEHSGILTSAMSPWHQFGLRFFGDGTVWVDALQVEEGAEATAFDP